MISVRYHGLYAKMDSGMSVQVGRGMNSIPKHIISDEEWENGKRYVCVECGVLNAEEEALKPYAEDSENLLEQYMHTYQQTWLM